MKISVIIPCYNCEASIGETLASILSQSYDDFEVIVVDDGSADDTARVLDGFRDRIRCIHQSNAGVSAARNVGAEAALGDWIAFCDSDDLWVIRKLELAAKAIAIVPEACDLVFSDFSVMDDGVVSEERGTMSRKTMFPVFREFKVHIKDMFDGWATLSHSAINGDDKIIDLFHGNIFRWLILGNVILPSTVLVRKSAFERVGGFRGEFRNAEDTEFFLRLSMGSNFMYVDEPLVTYRRTSTSLLATSMLKTIVNGIRSVELNCRENAAVYEEYREAIDRSLARKYAKLAYFHLSELEPRSAFRAARNSLRYKWAEKLAWLVLFGSMVPRPVLGVVRTVHAWAKR